MSDKQAMSGIGSTVSSLGFGLILWVLDIAHVEVPQQALIGIGIIAILLFLVGCGLIAKSWWSSRKTGGGQMADDETRRKSESPVDSSRRRRGIVANKSNIELSCSKIKNMDTGIEATDSTIKLKKTEIE